VAGLNGFKRIFEFGWKYLNFLKDRDLENDSRVYIKWICTQGLEYFKIRFKDVNQGIWKFDETNLKSDSECGFEGKEFWHPFGCGVRLGSEMKFKSRDLDFNEFLI
jgi:hypothetical protein